MLKRALAAIFASLILSIPSALAHTELVSSNPKQNAELSYSPASISLTFNENLIKLSGKNVSKISLLTEKGKVIALPKATVSKSTIRVKVPALKPNKYQVKFRVVSGDGHPVSGSFFFWVK